MDNKPTKEKSGSSLDLKLLKRLFRYMIKYSPLIILSVILLLLLNFALVIQPYLIKIGIDENVMRGDIEGLKSLSLLIFSLIVIAFGLNFFFNYIVQYIGQKLLMDLRMDLFKHVLKLPNSYFDRTPVGKTLTNVTNDVEAIRAFISEGVVTVVGELLKVLFILTAMFMINYKLALMTLVSIPVFIIGTLFFRNSIRKGFAGVRKANSEINTSLVETITGIKEIILFDHKSTSRDKFEESNKTYLTAYLKVINAYSLYFPIIEIVSNISMIVVFFYAHSIIGESIKVGEIFAFFTYINMFFRPLRELAEKFNMFQSAMAASERAFKLLDKDITIHNIPNSIRSSKRLEGKIKFNNVNFEYNKGNRILTGISFSIEKGEKIALVGNTGSGKTTIINLINRIYEVENGLVQIDDRNIKEYELEYLREQVGVVPQDPFFFNGTIYENLSLFKPDLTIEIVKRCSEKVHADGFIEKFENGYDEQVLEEGKKLSAGQKQLLSFTRALIKNPSIIILDEATSNIDSETEKFIEDATIKLLGERTSIIIAHRLSTIKMVDRIIVLKDGKVVEEGSHDDLILKRGEYYNLYQSQVFLLK
ncbi:MAG: ABC transporter ATP-binding protein [Candidatus Aminicenantes bacterium]|nr:ABC transporter ATP-binding protein [Candidatus Aminicenantes bacterium]